MSNEIEIKFLIEDLSSLQAKLSSIGFHQSTPSTHEDNILFDYPDLSLRKRGELLRVRRYGERWTVTHKAKSVNGRHKSRKETETGLADGSQLISIFDSLGLTPCFRYEKFRAEWTDGHGEVVLDHTPVGDVAEIEGDPEWIDETARKLGVSHSQYITASYAELFRQWKERTHSTAENMTFDECGTK